MSEPRTTRHWARAAVEKVSVPYRDRSGATYVFLHDERFIPEGNAIKLLQQERARTRRVIRAYRKRIDPLNDDEAAGKLIGCDELLRRLKP